MLMGGRTSGSFFVGRRQRDWLSRFSVHLFPRATSQADVLARIFDDCPCREKNDVMRHSFFDIQQRPGAEPPATSYYKTRMAW